MPDDDSATMIPDRLPDLSYVRSVDGTRIAWTRLGSGPTLVVVPPVPFSNIVGDWSIPLLREAYRGLAEDFDVLLYDGRGTGASQRDVEDLSIDALAGDLAAVLDDAKVKRAALLAIYLAAPPALTFAAAHPHRTDHIVLFGASRDGSKQLDRPGADVLFGLIDKDWGLFTKAVALDWMGWSVGQSGALVAESFRSATTPRIAKSALAAFADASIEETVDRVLAPTLVLHRRDGSQITLETSAALASSLPAGRLRILDGSSATLFFDDPGGTVSVIRDFARPGHATPAARIRSPGGIAISLTMREREVLSLIAAGESNSEIASRLALSVHTVERHASNIYRKIDARGRADATAWALRNGVA